MKATITFEEEEDLRTALDGYKWKLVAWDLDQEFRRLLKYDDNISDEKWHQVEELRTKLREIINDYGLNLD
jgi:hypothetical protein